MKTEKRKFTNYIPDILFVAVGVILDQVTKSLAVSHLKDQAPFEILRGIFELRYLENRGAAFGLLQNRQTYFLISTVIVVIVILWFYRRVPMNEKRFYPLRLCAAGILCGAIGNCIDRVTQKYVVDFFYFRLIDFPIFNVADIYVTVSTILLAVCLLFYYKEEDLDRIFHGRDID